MTTDVDAGILSLLRKRVNMHENTAAINSATKLQALEPDSLEFIEIIYELEQHFSISIDFAEVGKLDTVEDLINVVSNKLTQAA
jgi:acyl carrier protein